jgi:hypothetical protein
MLNLQNLFKFVSVYWLEALMFLNIWLVFSELKISVGRLLNSGHLKQSNVLVPEK